MLPPLSSRPNWLLGAFLLLLTDGILRAGDWPQFRGTTGSGVVQGSSLPATWSMQSGVRWQVDLPGQGNSSPAVTSQQIHLTTQTSDGSLWVVSVDRKTGKQLHKVNVGQGELVAAGAPELYRHRHNPATPSPVADEQNVWAFFGTGLLVCVDATSGQLKWQRDLVRDYGKYEITFGMASSPRLWRDKLFIACMTKGPSYVVALNKETGQEIWKTARQFDVADDHPDAYSSPVIWNTTSGPELVVAGAGHVNAYDPETGKQKWVTDGLTIDSPYGRVIASPSVSDSSNVVVATAPNPAGGGKGRVIGIVNGKQTWSYARATPDSSTPVIDNGFAYLLADNGVVTCLNVRNGKSIWQKRIGGGPYHASLIAGDGKVYCLGIDGVCTVIQAGRGGRIISRNALPGTFYATPAVADSTIYLRAYEKLYAVDGQ